jgi:fibronectin type 3 domain-containing protein
VTFAPAVTGSLTGSVMVTSNASNSPATISVSGTAIQLLSRSATLSWNPSSSVVSGYHVYSSLVSGGPYAKLTPVPTLTTNYSDTSVQSGRTYYYVVTAVSASSVESFYSNQATAVIP